jgi:hypothetical protein
MPTPAGSPWPAECRGAVSLTFDDGRASQLARAVPLLRDHGLRGTFYVNPRDADWAERLAPWRAVAAEGHEIGNHTIGHLCGRALQDDPDILCLETTTLVALEADILEASERIRAGIPEQTGPFSFCYPCYHDHVGEGETRQSYVPLIARHFVAGRGRGEYGHNHPATCDLAYLYSWNVEFMSGPLLVGLAQQAAARGRWAIFTIHGIEDGHLPLAEIALAELCRYLADARTALWTAPVIEVAQHMAAWRRAPRVRTGE